MPEIHGNTEGLRRSLLAEMEKLYAWDMSRDTFVPTEMVDVLGDMSLRINREIAVYITRDGEVVDVIVGGLDSVLGALVGGILIGLVEALAGAYLGGEYKLLATFVVLVVILMARPYGLFGTHEIERL